MLKLCEEYAMDFDVDFNGSKSKCIVNRPRRTYDCAVHFSVGGQDIEIVDNWPHLGHVISKAGDSKLDIARRHSKFRLTTYFVRLVSWTVIPRLDY